MVNLKKNLLFKIVMAISLGVLIGIVSPDWIVRVLATFNSLFGNFLGFIVPLIIVGLIAPGIADLGKGGGKLLSLTVGLAYGSTLIGGVVAMLVGINIMPELINIDANVLASFSNPEHSFLTPLFKIEIPAIMGTTTAIVLAFSLGIGMTMIEGKVLHNAMSEFKKIVEFIIKKVIIKLLPFHILGVFANMTYSGQIGEIMATFLLVILCVVVVHFIAIVGLYIIAGIMAGVSPFALMKNMIQAYLTAVGTQSSAATIPVTLNCTKKNGVDENIANFTIPLLATIHLTGSTISLTLLSITIMLLTGMEIDILTFVGFIFMLGVTAMAAPGIPGGTVMAALGILQSILGFNEGLLSLMIALFITQDSFGTACNVTGDGALSVIVNKIAGFKLKSAEEQELEMVDSHSSE